MDRKPGILVSAAVVAAMLAVSGWVWGQIPADARLPVHWGVEGTPDRYGGKFEALLMLPLITVGIAALLAVLPRFEPRREHLARSFGAYTVIWGAVILLMGAVHVLVVLSALGYAVNVAAAISAGAGLLFVVIGRRLGQVESNFIMGIRTPWTLSSELSWRKTHQLGGRLFMALGALLALTAPFSGPLAVALAVGGGLAVLVTILVYSYRVWSLDPNRQTLGR